MTAEVLALALTFADVVHVDGDVTGDPCAGSGDAAMPYGSLQCALAAGGLGPGDRIEIHDAAMPYAGASTAGLGLGSGTFTDPVVIAPAEGAAPIFAGAIELVDVSHWTLRGLTFAGDGCDGQTEGAPAIFVASSGPGVSGVVIEDDVVLDWPGRAIHLEGISGELVDITVRGNRIPRRVWPRDVGVLGRRGDNRRQRRR